MNNLEIVEVTLKKYDIKFHKLVEGDYTYIMPFKDGDKDGYIFVSGYGLIPLVKSGQFRDFMEFYKGDIASY
jgi:hypothetical protein